jgi:hypothetical protein
MEDKKHIDRLFQENLKDFEVFPDENVWKNIEQQLVKKKKRRVIPLWLRLGGVAATLLLLISSGIWFFKTDEPLQNTPDTNSIITDVDFDKKDNNIDNSKDQENLQKNQIDSKKGTNVILKTPGKGTIQLKNKTTTRFASSAKNNESNISSETTNEANNLIEDSNKSTVGIDTKKETIDTSSPSELKIQTEKAIASIKKEEIIDNNKPKQDINEALKEKENTIVLEEDATNTHKWSVGSTVAPVYFNSLAQGSPIDAALKENSKSTNASISYGVKVNYKINDKLSLQSGINSVELAYTTKNVTALVSSNEALTNSTNLNTNVDGFSIVTTSSDNLLVQGAELITERTRSSSLNLSGDLNQSMSYIEIPMEAKYSLLQQKFGVNVVGGVSTYILYKNGISILNENGSTTLGEASNINDVNFSGNLGLDFDYKINKKLFINVSPMFKYQLNTFSKNDGGFKPYYLGVYTGLNFRF